MTAFDPASQRARLAGGVVAVAVLTFAYRYLSFEEFSNDHFVHLSIAQQIARGAWPVRDFVERGIPLMSLFSAGAQMVLGEGLRSELIVIAAAYGAAAAFTFVAAAWLSRSLMVGAVAALVPVLAYPISYSYPKLLAPAVAVVAALGYTRRPSRLRLLLVSASIAFALLLRHDLGLFIGLGVVALLAAQHGITRTSMIEAGRVAVFTLLLVSPYAVWVQAYQGIGDYVAQGVALSSREAERANWWQPPPLRVDTTRPLLRRLVDGPVVNVRWQPDAAEDRIVRAEQRHGLVRLELNSPQSWRYMLTSWGARDLEALVRDPLAADTHGIDRSTFRLQVPAPSRLGSLLVHVYGPGEGLRLAANSFVVLLYVLWLLPIAASIVLAVRWRQTSPEWRGPIAMIIVVQLAMNASMLRDPLDTRARDVFVPLALLMAFLAGLAWTTSENGRHRLARRVMVAMALVLVVGSAASLGGAPAAIERTQIAEGVEGLRNRARTIRRRFAPPDQRTGPRSAIYQPIVEYITRCTSPHARLLTLTFAPELFFYTGRAFAGGQVSLSPGYFVTERDADALLTRMSAEDVPLVIMDSQTQQEMLDGYPRIGAHVARHYHEVERFTISDDKAFVVLAQNGRPMCARLE